MRHLPYFLAASLPLLAANFTLAEEYPSRPITIVVPAAAGSSTDDLTRLISQRLSEKLKQPIIIDHRPGANTQIGVEYLSKQKPDGYTLMMSVSTAHAANPALVKRLPYDPIKDFTPIIRVSQVPFVISVGNSIPAVSLKEFIEYARINPGKVTFGAANAGSQIAGETLKAMAKIDMVGANYKASSQALTDLIAGHVSMYAIDFVTGLPSIQAKRIRPLAVTTKNRSPLLPNIPAVSETLPGYDVTSWNGFFAPANLPPEIAKKLEADIRTVLSEKPMQEAIYKRGAELTLSKSPEDFTQYIRDQIALWAMLTKQAGIQPE